MLNQCTRCPAALSVSASLSRLPARLPDLRGQFASPPRRTCRTWLRWLLAVGRTWVTAPRVVGDSLGCSAGLHRHAPSAVRPTPSKGCASHSPACRLPWHRRGGIANSACSSPSSRPTLRLRQHQAAPSQTPAASSSRHTTATDTPSTPLEIPIKQQQHSPSSLLRHPRRRRTTRRPMIVPGTS